MGNNLFQNFRRNLVWIKIKDNLRSDLLTRGIIAVAAKQNGARPAQAGEGTSSAVRANFEEIFKRPLGVAVVKKLGLWKEWSPSSHSQSSGICK